MAPRLAAGVGFPGSRASFSGMGAVRVSCIPMENCYGRVFCRVRSCAATMRRTQATQTTRKTTMLAEDNQELEKPRPNLESATRR